MSVGVGVAGFGWMGQNLAEILAEMDAARLSGMADTDEERRALFDSSYEAPTFESVDELVIADGIDALVVATPHSYHLEHAVSAMRSGLDVLVEKPMVTSMSEAEELTKITEETGSLVQIGYYRSFHPVFCEIRHLLTTNQIGDPRMVAAHLGQSWLDLNRETWRTDSAVAEGGLLFDSGAHLLDGLLWSLDAKPVSVTGMMDDCGQSVDVNSALAATLDVDGQRLVASIGISGEGVGLTPDEVMTVYGTDGRLTYRHEPDTSDGAPYQLDIVSESGTTTRTFELPDPFYVTRKKLDAFVSAVAEGGRSPVSIEHGRQLTAFREAARQSWTEMRRVDIADVISGESHDEGPI